MNHIICSNFPRLFIAAKKLAFTADSGEILVSEFEFIGISVLTDSIRQLLLLSEVPYIINDWPWEITDNYLIQNREETEIDISKHKQIQPQYILIT